MNKLSAYQEKLLPHFKSAIQGRLRNNPIPLNEMPDAFERFFEWAGIKMKTPEVYDCKMVARYLSLTGYPIASISQKYFHCRLPQDLRMPIEELLSMRESINEQLLRYDKLQSKLTDAPGFAQDGSLIEKPLEDYTSIRPETEQAMNEAKENNEVIYHNQGEIF